MLHYSRSSNPNHSRDQAGAPHSQHIVPEATFPLSLVEEVIEVAAEGDEHKAKGQEAKNACGVQRGTHYQNRHSGSTREEGNCILSTEDS